MIFISIFPDNKFTYVFVYIPLEKKLWLSIGEKVLCYHGQLLYEAKLLKIQVKDRAVKYLIHYRNWSKNWVSKFYVFAVAEITPQF